VNIDKKNLDAHTLEITVKVTKAEAQPWLDKAAAHLSEHKPIKGFRPGKAPYDIVKREYGEPAIMQEALEDVINGTFNQVLDTEKLNTYGRIKFDLLPALDANDIVSYKATMTLMPEVRLGDWQKSKIKRQEVKVSDQELNSAIDELANMTATEQPVDRPAKMGDKTVIDFEVSVDGKVIEGGTAKDFGLLLGEGRMIPGFEEKIVDHKAGDKFEFDLAFPANYKSHLSGKLAHFAITLAQVMERVKPAIDDAFAKRVGVEDLAELKQKIGENIKKEKEAKEDERLEIAAMKQVVEVSDFDPLPQKMIQDAVEDLTHDFEHSLAHEGVNFDQYVSSTGKTKDSIKKEFEPKAINRIKSSMALGKVAEAEKLEVTQAEIETELAAQKQLHGHNKEALNDLAQPEYRRHVANSLINRKLINFIKSKIIE
jgi:trigger factor